MKHCKKPCPECPYRKDSEPEYFGDNDPQEYADALHLDTVVACHTKSGYDANGNVNDVVICAGHLIAQKKVCKSTQHPDALQVLALEEFQEMVEEKRDEVHGFSFYSHHNI